MRREWLAVAAILLTIGRGAVREIEKSAAREIQQRIGGEIEVRIRLAGANGLTRGTLSQLIVNARGFTLDGFPFTLQPERPRSGHIRRFILNLHDARLRGLRAESAYGEIPDVYYDRHLALTKRIFRLSATGKGHAQIVVNESDLADYIRRKYAPYLREVRVQIRPEQTIVEGRALLIGSEVAFRAVGTLAPREGVYLDLTSAELTIEGAPLPPPALELLRQWFNPIIDLNRDLGIYDGLSIAQVVSEMGKMKAIGSVWIPSARD